MKETLTSQNLKKFNSNLIKVNIVADSINQQGNRITTFVCVFPRIVLSEFNTHRLFSRNSASSRAIPFAKMIKKISNAPFVPTAWMKEHKGMQGSEYFEDLNDQKTLLKSWLKGRDLAIKSAQELSSFGVTKQICNRILEPYMMQKVIVTATEWANFFALRAHDDAEIHIAELAFKMLEAYNQSLPKKLTPGQWHIPFGDHFDVNRIKGLAQTKKISVEKLKIAIATARCARISYLNFEGKDDYEKDLILFKRLSKAGHWSPFEHCAKAMNLNEYKTMTKHEEGKIEQGWCGNFRGYIQLRKTFLNENKKDERIIK